eukprot:6987251-Heterocapsa_arctica.AAC.1
MRGAALVDDLVLDPLDRVQVGCDVQEVLLFHSSQCSSVPSNFSSRVRPFRSTIEARRSYCRGWQCSRCRGS